MYMESSHIVSTYDFPIWHTVIISTHCLRSHTSADRAQDTRFACLYSEQRLPFPVQNISMVRITLETCT